MLLRTAFLENKVLSLEFMENFSEQALEAELGPYTQGFDLVRYIGGKIWGNSHNHEKPYDFLKFTTF
jgi:hypothetical protein